MASISIIVVSQDNREHVAKLLRSLAIYRHFDGEIHLIDNASVDGTAEEACAAGLDGIALTVVRRRVRRPLPENRNLGARLSRGDILLFCDSDVIFEDTNFSSV